MSGGKQLPFRRRNEKRIPSDDEGTAELSSSKKAKVSTIALTSLLLIFESEVMDITPTGKAWAMLETVDTMGQILYEVDSDQCDFELY
jgi:hypothetical protein